MSVIVNPFPGPQPYRGAHAAFFCGREELSRRLCQSVLAHGVLTVYGPSGAGKSSVVQARVLRLLEEEYDVRAVTVDSWPEGIPPAERLLDEMVRQLSLDDGGSARRSADRSPQTPVDRAPEGEAIGERIGKAVRLAEQRSEQAIVIHLDQIEQLLFPGRPGEDLDGLIAAVAALAERPARGLRVMLALREDYLGLLRARTRGRRQLLDRSLRVGPLTVDEMADAVCTAAGRGEPAQAWSRDEIAELLLDVRAPGQEPTGEAEVQAVYAQIVCRALWADRAAAAVAPAADRPKLEAQPILERYLEATLADLGTHKDAALRLLEDHLVTRDGRRNLRTQSELERELPGVEIGAILHSLEIAGVLRGHEHQGEDRYFEVGHDWLARRVFERKEARRRQEAERAESDRRYAETERLLALAKHEGDARAREETARSRRQRRFAIGGGVVLLIMGSLAATAWTAARRATELSHLAAARELTARGRPAWAAKLLLEMDARTPAWSGAALDALARSAPQVTLEGHTETVRAVAWSPDGTRVASASDDHTARIFPVAPPGEPIVLRGHTDAVLGVGWSPDGRRLVTWSGDGTARVWAADGRGAPLTLEHGSGVNDAAWSPDGRRLAVALRDHTARVWDLESPEASVDLAEHLREVLSVSWSPDGRRVATTSNDLSAMIWDLARPQAPLVLGEPTLLSVAVGLRGDHEGHTGAVLQARWSPDGTRVVTASSDNTARVWNADGSGRPVVLGGHASWVLDAQWSPDGASIVTASRDKTARVFRADGVGDAVALIGHTDAVCAARFRSDGLRIVTASTDATARVWLASGAGQPVVLWGHDSRLLDARWSADGSRIATASEDDSVKVWTGKAWNVVGAAPVLPVPKIHSADLAPDGRRVLIAASDQHAAVVWSLPPGGPTVTLPFGVPFDPNLVAFSPDGQRVALGADNGTVRVMGADGSESKSLPPVDGSHRRLAYNLAWSPESRRVLVSTELGVEIWDTAPTTPVRTALIVGKGHAGFASWSPDGQRIAVISNGGDVVLARADGSGEPVPLGAHKGQGFVALFSPDGQRVLSAGADKVARVWSLAGGAPLELRHSSTILLAAWSPDGRRVVTGTGDRVASVWSLDGAAAPAYEPMRLPHEDVLSAVAFTRDGARVLTVSQGSVRSWPSSYPAFADALRTVNDDCLPVVLRRKYLDEDEASAGARYQACERLAGRGPSLSPAP